MGHSEIRTESSVRLPVSIEPGVAVRTAGLPRTSNKKGFIMEYLVGVVLALAVSIGATLVGADRERTFYPTVLIVVATYYALFAVLAGSTHALMSEAIPIVLFIVVAIAGFRRGLWWAAAGLVGHGIFDLLHGHVIFNPGVPAWWPGWCLSYDLTAGGYLGFLLWRSKVNNRPDGR